MTKSELIEILASKMSHLSEKDVELVVNTLFDSMVEALQRGDRIEVRGFGSFSIRERRARNGRNPKTGVNISVPPKRVPFFTIGNELWQRLNRTSESDSQN